MDRSTTNEEINRVQKSNSMVDMINIEKYIYTHPKCSRLSQDDSIKKIKQLINHWAENASPYLTYENKKGTFIIQKDDIKRYFGYKYTKIIGILFQYTKIVLGIGKNLEGKKGIGKSFNEAFANTFNIGIKELESGYANFNKTFKDMNCRMQYEKVIINPDPNMSPKERSNFVSEGIPQILQEFQKEFVSSNYMPPKLQNKKEFINRFFLKL
ncbi:MAG: hypothetical protein J6C05_11865 [Prevotella sp.]|nr:hypothetical protein [Prevotella sp.]